MAGSSPTPKGGRGQESHPGRPASSAASPPRDVRADLPITLGQFVKLAGMAATGGDAKQMVIGGLVRVNGETDTRRGRKLVFGDVVKVGREEAVVVARGARSVPDGVRTNEGEQPAPGTGLAQQSGDPVRE